MQSRTARRSALTALWLGSLALNLLARPSVAEQRALLVGVGKYQIQGHDLPAIDLDIERMHDMLILLGFKDSQMHILRDEQATSANVVAEFKSWLIKGVQPTDRVVFYFSGHGSNIPALHPELEGDYDQVLVTNDVRFTRVNGKQSLAGVVPDFEIADLLAAIPSQNVLFMSDSCHSGTVTRSFTPSNQSLGKSDVYAKSFDYPGMPVPRPQAHTRALTGSLSFKWNPKVNYVAVNAAGDDEEAIGTAHGGVFTLGLTEAVKTSVAEGKTINMMMLRDQTEDYIKLKVDKAQLYTPQIMGNQSLATRELVVSAAVAADGPNRKRLLDLVSQQPQHLQMTASSTKYVIDQPLKLTLTIPSAGYLNLVSVDSKDVATVLFPNHYQDDNAVKAGPFVLPTEQMTFDLLAAPPTGQTLVVAFLTSDPINFFKETDNDRDANGNIKVDFASLSATSTRAIRVAPRKAGNAAAQMDLQIVEAAANH